jgi:glucose/arabinose dehydrogenase
MKRRMLFLTLALAVVALAALAVSGCGSKDAQDAQEAQEAQAPQETQAAPAATETEAAAPAEGVAVHDCAGGCGMTNVPEDQLTEIDGKWYCAGCAKKVQESHEGHGHG